MRVCVPDSPIMLQVEMGRKIIVVTEESKDKNIEMQIPELRV